jgi:Outer membrane lipoprotein carrier protein LolA-like
MAGRSARATAAAFVGLRFEMNIPRRQNIIRVLVALAGCTPSFLPTAVFLAASSVARAEPALPTLGAPPENLFTDAYRLNAVQPGEPWDKLLTELRGKTNIAATFTENRYLPFKKIPVVFEGEIRLSKEKGLSLHYTSPDSRTMVVDDRGLLMRDGSGRTREVPADPRALAATGTLLHVMRFDLAELSKAFDVYAAGDTGNWHFGFDPKDDAVAHSLNRLVVSGQKDQVRRIVIRKSALQSVEIIIHETREGVAFTEDELKQYFR